MAPLRRHGARLSTISRHVCPRGPTSLRNCPDPNSALALSLSICCRPFVPLRMFIFFKSQVTKRKVVGKKEFAKGCEAIGFEGQKSTGLRGKQKV